jgi:hypothetical protein
MAISVFIATGGLGRGKAPFKNGLARAQIPETSACSVELLHVPPTIELSSRQYPSLWASYHNRDHQ